MTSTTPRLLRRHRTPHSFALLLLVTAATAFGCGTPFEPATPQGFVELPDPQQYDYRATTADGLVIAIRALDHEPRGELAFWLKAIENEVRDHKGYALLETRDVKNVQGLSGKQLRFGYDEGKKPHLYYVTLFVTDSELFLIETGGDKELMLQKAQELDWAVQNFKVD